MIRIKINKNLLKIFFYCYLLFAICQLLTGCATIPTTEALPAYNINGAVYYSLVSLCDSRNIDWQYDTFTRTAVLTSGLHKINLRAGDTFVLVDGRPLEINHPVDIYQGTLVVPYKFKEQVIDDLFKESYPLQKIAFPILKIKKIVIDAGHGGVDPGATGKSGLREKDVNLDIAKRLSILLRSEGIEVVMTRTIDRFVPLSTRVEIANNARADLFLSIHANANRVRRLNGFEVYYVAGTVSDSKRAYAAAKSAVLNLDSACFASQSLDLKAILWDMTYTYSRAESIELSRAICRSIDSNLGVPALRIKGAGFQILKEARMPAVLIEVGFLSNYDEERKLKNSYYRQKVVESIAQGVGDYARGFMLMEASNK